MKTIEEMAQKYIEMEVGRVGLSSIDDIRIADAWRIAKAMQAEAEKRKATPNADPMRKVRESQWQPDWSQAPEYCVMTDYHDGCYVYFNGELCVAHGVNNTPVAVPKDSLRKRP